MKNRSPLWVAFLLLVLVGALRQSHARRGQVPTAESVMRTRSSSLAMQTGSFPASWNAGVGCPNEPDFQVHAYNEDLFIIRQSKCRTHEAPFLYLLFGDDAALLLDTGANPTTDLYGTVRQIIERWLDARGQDWIRLVVAHSHGHGDHTAGNAQFVGQPYVAQVVGLSTQAVHDFWGFQDFPNDIPSLDLGGRVLDVLGTPGHHPNSITLYDRNTHLLLTGDIVYPGHLFIFGPGPWNAFKRSLRRMAHWANTHPVEWVLGCHIEFSAVPFEPYRYGLAVHPNEHVLQFPPSELIEIRDAAYTMGSSPQCQVFDEFVIHPVHICGAFWNG